MHTYIPPCIHTYITLHVYMHTYMYVYIALQRPAQTDLHGKTCTDRPAQTDLHRHTCTERAAQRDLRAEIKSHAITLHCMTYRDLHRKTCTKRFVRRVLIAAWLATAYKACMRSKRQTMPEVFYLSHVITYMWSYCMNHGYNITSLMSYQRDYDHKAMKINSSFSPPVLRRFVANSLPRTLASEVPRALGFVSYRAPGALTVAIVRVIVKRFHNNDRSQWLAAPHS